MTDSQLGLPTVGDVTAKSPETQPPSPGAPRDHRLEADLGLATASQTYWTILVEPTVVATA